MAEERRRVRDVSESSETGQSLNDSVNLNITECESEGGTQLSQSAATISESEDQHDKNEETEDEEFHDADDAADGSGSETGTQTGEEEETGSETDEGTEEEEGEVRDSSESEETEDKKGDDSSGWIEERRHSGDGQEHVDNAASEKKLDIDEDKSNPAYIPRQGLFFEHDLRLGDEDDKTAAEKEEAGKKRLWTTDNRKWTHDRYDERMQAPKSAEELVEIYGYNIRRESGPNGDGPVPQPRRGRGKRGARGSQRLGDFIITTGDGDQNDGDRNNETAAVEARNDTRDDRDASNRRRYDDENHIDNERTPQRDNNYSSDRPSRGRGGRGRYSDMRQRPGYENRTDNGERERTGFRGRGGMRQRGFGRGDGFSGDRRHNDDNVAESSMPPREFRAQNSQRTGPDNYNRGATEDDRIVENKRSGAENSQDFRRNAAERGSGSRGGFDGRGFNRGRNFRGSETGEHRAVAQRPASRPGGSEDWDDEVCRVTERMETKAAVVESRPGHVEGSEVVQRARESSTFDDKGVGRGGYQPKLPREPHDAQIRQGFPTRTISNRHYGDADSHLPPPPGLDRRSQIGDIVDVMKKIAVTGTPARSDVSSSAGRQQSSGTVPPAKTTVITTAPYSADFVPPVTRTQTRTAAPPITQQAAQQRDPPAAYHNKLDELKARRVPSPAAAGMPGQPPGGQPLKPKRYSTQRQRLPADADPASGERISETPTPGGAPSNMSAVIQQQPVYYAGDVERAAVPYPGQAPPPGHMVPVGSLAYRLPGMPPESYYHSPQPVSQSGNSPPSLMHAARYIGPSQLMAPAQPGGQPYYISNPPPTMYSYPPHLIAAAARPYGIAPMHHQYIQAQPSAPSPQQPMMSEVSPSMEVRSGTVYFNAETQQPEVRVGGIYYGPPGVQPAPPSTAISVRRPNSAIPIINPQSTDEASVDAQQYYADIAMAPPGYVYSNYPPSAGGEPAAMQYTYGPVENIPEAETETGYA